MVYILAVLDWHWRCITKTSVSLAVFSLSLSLSLSLTQKFRCFFNKEEAYILCKSVFGHFSSGVQRPASETRTLIQIPWQKYVIYWKWFQHTNWLYGNLITLIKYNGISSLTASMSVLLYGCITRTLTKSIEKKPDEKYTRMLRAVLNKSWEHPTK